MKNIALKIIKFYRHAISPHFPPVCRYHPSCSSYAYDAVKNYGVLRGALMAVKRIMRCHPFHRGGYDPVPLPGAGGGVSHVCGEVPLKIKIGK